MKRLHAKKNTSQAFNEIVKTYQLSARALEDARREATRANDKAQDTLNARNVAFGRLVRAWRQELVARFGVDLAHFLSPGPEDAPNS